MSTEYSEKTDAKHEQAGEKFQPIKNIDIYQFVLEFPESSIKNLTELLLDKAEAERDYISQSVLLSKSNSDEQKLGPLKQFVADIKEKIIEIYFAYHFIKSHQYGGIDHTTQHRDQYFVSLCGTLLKEDRNIIGTASYLVVWLTSDDMFLRALQKFPVSKVNSNDLDAAKRLFIESLIKSNTDSLRAERASNLEKTKKEILESTLSLDSKVKKLSDCLMENSEVTVSQLKSFHDIISSVYEYQFKNSIDKKIPPSQVSLFFAFSKSNYKVTKLSSYDAIPEEVKASERRMDFFGYFKKPFSFNPAQVIKRFELAESGISIFVSNADQDIQAVLEAYKVNQDEYRLSFMDNQECKIEINNHEKIIAYLKSTGAVPRETYQSYGLDYDSVCTAFGISSHQFINLKNH